jgi:hypothetical protein
MITLSKLKRVNRTPRRLIVTVAIALGMVLIAAYASWSVNTWGSYKTTYENWQKGLRTSVDTAMALPETTAKERAAKLTAFKAISSTITSAQDSLCHTPVIITWQHVIVSLRQREEACAQTIGKANSFGKSMELTTSYLESEQAVAAIIEKALAASQDKLTEATWGSQAAIWQDADKNMGKVSSGVAFAPVKAGAFEKIKVLESAWQELLAAHTAKDKAKYTEAQSKLVVAYGALASLSTVGTEQLAPLTLSLQSAYSQLFTAKV